MAKNDKTNVMRVLEQKKIPYEMLTYGDGVNAMSGVEVAVELGINAGRVFKTLVTRGHSKAYYVFMVPVAKELDLKKAAAAVGEKNIEMILSKELLPLTGYVHGGCSPIGMKKLFKTTIDESAFSYDYIMFSGGKIGFQVKMSPEDLNKVIPLEIKAIAQ